MQLGFIGTGEITSSMVAGLCSLGGAAHSIWLSPRNAAMARELANRFEGVSVASSNQEVLDHCEMSVIAVGPAIASAVLSALRFRSDHHVISVVSGLPKASLSRLATPAVRITRAVPLPSAAQRLSPTAIYPHDPAAHDLFAMLGTVFPVESEKEFDAVCATTATIGFYFAFKERIASWLAQQGVQGAAANEYVARLFFGVAATTADASQYGFESLATRYATKGGINEQFLKHMMNHGLLKSVSEGLDVIRDRISARLGDITTNV